MLTELRTRVVVVGVELDRCVCESVLLHTVFVEYLYVNVKMILILSYMKSV